MKRVSVVTVNYKNYAVTEDLVLSIYQKNSYPDLEIIVVDNASEKVPAALFQEKHPDVIFVAAEENLGFAGGNNLGISKATGDYIFLVNNDTVFTEHLVETLVQTLEHHSQVGIVSPKIRYFDQPDTLQYVGFTPMNYYTIRNACMGQFEKDRGQYDRCVGPTGYAHGAAMMVRRAAMDKVGLMAENFFLYYEELDWCERFKKAGFEIWVDATALIYHKESLSVGKRSALKEYYMNRNRILFARKHVSAIRYLFFLLYFLLVVVTRNILTYIRNKEYRYIPVLLKAVWWNFTNSVASTRLYFPRVK